MIAVMILYAQWGFKFLQVCSYNLEIFFFHALLVHAMLPDTQPLRVA